MTVDTKEDTEELNFDLMASCTDLPRFLAAAQRTDLPYLVIASEAVRAWEQREPELWARFSKWLNAQGKSIVEI